MVDEQFSELVLKLVVSLAIGLFIGGEREYRNKSAGLRTIMLICVGSTIFSIVSLEASHESEISRIASNIVTGIGFLGAGAIMRYGISISGLTTASTIWVAAALGMSVGFGMYQLAIVATIITLVVLVLFTYLQKAIDKFYKTMELHVVFNSSYNEVDRMETEMKRLKIRFTRVKESRREGDVRYEFELAGRRLQIDQLVHYLVAQKEKVKSFEY